jgi:hypothetical protein
VTAHKMIKQIKKNTGKRITDDKLNHDSICGDHPTPNEHLEDQIEKKMHSKRSTNCNAKSDDYIDMEFDVKSPAILREQAVQYAKRLRLMRPCMFP